MPLDDIIKDQTELAGHTYEMRLWPRQWRAYPNRVACNWQRCRLEEASRATLPRTSGVYTFVLVSEVAGHPNGNYLMYVGKTDSLWRRFGEYLTSEKRETGRPKIFRLLNLYESHIWFYYTEAPQADITMLEDDLTNAFIPPCNDRMPAAVRAIRGAFD